MEDVKVKSFLEIGSGDGYGSGYGSGDGYGSGYGSGDGDGYGSGSGSGYGDGDGYGSGDGYGYGDGDGYGSGSGSGYGYGPGDGSGSGYGYGIESVCGMQIHRIDIVPTVLTAIHGNVAKGYILHGDLNMSPCYVVKGNTLFAHGDSVRSAMAALRDKMFEDMPEEERIAEFIKAHPDPEREYPNQDLFEWHNKLTGSCESGRKAFIQDRGLTLEGSTTVAEFINLTRNAYNGSVIRNLEQAYKEGAC